MTRAQALHTLKTTRKLNTAMLKPLGVTFEQFLRFAQLGPATTELAVDRLIERTERRIARGTP